MKACGHSTARIKAGQCEKCYWLAYRSPAVVAIRDANREKRAARKADGSPCRKGHRDRYPGGACRPCTKERNDKRLADPEAKAHDKIIRDRKVHIYRARNRLKNTGWSQSDFDAAFRVQLGDCAVCRRPLKEAGGAHADHCHITKRIRSLLCQKCNRGLGHFNDDAVLLREAAIYVERFK